MSTTLQILRVAQLPPIEKKPNACILRLYCQRLCHHFISQSEVTFHNSQVYVNPNSVELETYMK